MASCSIKIVEIVLCEKEPLSPKETKSLSSNGSEMTLRCSRDRPSTKSRSCSCSNKEIFYQTDLSCL